MVINPCDLFVFPNQSDVAVEWMVLDLPIRHDAIVRSVPLDQNTSLIGSVDVDLTDLAGIPLVARCGLCRLLNVGSIEAGTKVGGVSSEILFRVCRHLADLARGRDTGTLPQHVTDQDPEYQAHIDDIKSVVP